jgi:regulator of protease activity HflC (stomatin/prohibitin superfamily)
MAMRKVFKYIVTWIDRRLMSVTVILMLAAFAALASVPYVLVNVPAGHVGVLWKRFGGGTVLDRVYNEGTHLILPLNIMAIYDTRLQTLNQTFNVISRDGLEISIDVALRYRVVPNLANLLHKEIGPDYVNTVLVPDIYSQLSTELSQNDPSDIYSTKRIEVQQRIYAALASSTSVATGQAGDEAQFIQIDDVLLRAVRLPPALRDAVVRKNQEQQTAEEYRYRLQAEELEAQRKRVEAEGIRDFQKIINQNMTREYLTMRGIDATLKLAESNNAKVIVVGKGDSGLSLIYNGIDQASAQTAPRKETPSMSPAGQPTDQGVTSPPQADEGKPPAN